MKLDEKKFLAIPINIHKTEIYFIAIQYFIHNQR
jgi:hypothetical protein